MEKRFYVVPLCNIRAHFVTIDSADLHGIMREICPEFKVSRKEVTGVNREKYEKNIFEIKRLKVSEQKVFTGVIETDGVSMCVHRNRWGIHVCTPSALEGGSSCSMLGLARNEA